MTLAAISVISALYKYVHVYKAMYVCMYACMHVPGAPKSILRKEFSYFSQP